MSLCLKKMARQRQEIQEPKLEIQALKEKRELQRELERVERVKQSETGN